MQSKMDKTKLCTFQATPPSRPKRPRRPPKKPSSSEIAESESDSEESDEVHRKVESATTEKVSHTLIPVVMVSDPLLPNVTRKRRS